jgi:hypothetical protein
MAAMTVMHRRPGSAIKVETGGDRRGIAVGTGTEIGAGIGAVTDVT